jgi:plastocyanin
MRLQSTLAMAIAIVCAAAPRLAAAAGGTITGTVQATPPKYLPETVVYLQNVPGTTAPKTAVIDQQNKVFVPHVLAIARGDTVQFQNHDHFDHNVYSPEGKYNLGVWGFGQTRTHTFTSTGVFTQLCSLHPEMLAYVFVGQNRYAAVVDDKGHFTIQNVPPGRYTLAVWNSHLKASPQTVTVTAGQSQQVNLSLARP